MKVDQAKVFFSYARADAEFVLKLANDLRSAGVNLWIDQLDIMPGERWDNAVENALTASPYLLVVLSPASVASQNVMDEVAFALENNKKLVPVLHTRCAIPFRLQRLQYIDFTGDYDNGLTQLVKTLKVAQSTQTPPDPEGKRQPHGFQDRTEEIPTATRAARGAKDVPADSPGTLTAAPESNIRTVPFWRSVAGIWVSAAAVIAAVTGLVFVWHRDPPQQQVKTPQQEQTAGLPRSHVSIPAAAVKVYIHTSEDRNLAALEDLGNALRAKGYEVSDTRLSSARTAGDIRFFFPQDRDAALRLKSAVESQLSDRGYRVALELLERDGTEFQHAAPGKIEIWLPSLTKNAATRQ